MCKYEIHPAKCSRIPIKKVHAVLLHLCWIKEGVRQTKTEVKQIGSSSRLAGHVFKSSIQTMMLWILKSDRVQSFKDLHHYM